MSMANPYEANQHLNWFSAVHHWGVVTPSDDNDVKPIGVAIRNNSEECIDVLVVPESGGEVTLHLAPLETLSTSVRRVKATGTTAPTNAILVGYHNR